MSIIPLNVESNIFYDYYRDSNEAIEKWIKKLDDLSSPNSDIRYLKFDNICFANWSLKLGKLVEDERYSLHIGILVPTFEINSINSIIENFNSHDLEIIYRKDLAIIEVRDDFGTMRSNLSYIDNNNNSIMNASFIIVRINPHSELDLHIRQIISYLLATILRMFSITEGHVEEWCHNHNIDICELGKFLNYNKTLEYICEINNYYVEKAVSRDQLISSSIKITPKLLLKANNVELSNELFKNCNISMIKPTQSTIILALKGAPLK